MPAQSPKIGSDIEDYLEQTCDIYRRAPTKSAGGAYVDSEPTEVATDVPCLLQPIISRIAALELMDFGETSAQRWRGYFEQGTDIENGDFIKLDTNKVFRVFEKCDPTGTEHHVFVQLETMKADILGGW